MAGPHTVLVLSGDGIAARDQLIFNAFVAQLAVVIEQRRLQAEADHAHTLAEADALGSALLQAVSHDLRTPLASIRSAPPAWPNTTSTGRTPRLPSSSKPSTRRPTGSHTSWPTSST